VRGAGGGRACLLDGYSVSGKRASCRGEKRAPTHQVSWQRHEAGSKDLGWGGVRVRGARG